MDSTGRHAENATRTSTQPVDDGRTDVAASRPEHPPSVSGRFWRGVVAALILSAVGGALIAAVVWLLMR